MPEAGYEPVLTGNRALDLTQNYVNEFESQLRRDASLVRSSMTALRASRPLKSLAVVLALLVVALFALLLYAINVTLFDAGDPFGAFFAAAASLLLGVPALYVVSSVVAFSAAVAAGLGAVEGRRRSFGALLRGAVRARGALGALTIARVARWSPSPTVQAGGPLYEAFAVFAVPVAMSEGTRSADDAQRRSEALVAERWGPGRFRALGLPRTNPWSVVYSRGVTRHGYKAPYIAAGAFLAVVLGPLLVAVASGNETAILVTFGWTWGTVALGGLAWSAVLQPVLQGLLRAHLYHYAKTGKAAEPYGRDALHACLREEARASMGLPQRKPGPTPAVGVGGVVKSFARDPSAFVQAESGLAPADVRAVIADARLLYKDGRLVTKALRRAADGMDAGALLNATGLPRDRCRTAVVNLLWAGKLRATITPAGEAVFSLDR